MQYLAQGLPAGGVEDEVGPALVRGRLHQRLTLRHSGEPHLVLFVEEPPAIVPARNLVEKEKKKQQQVAEPFSAPSG